MMLEARRGTGSLQGISWALGLVERGLVHRKGNDGEALEGRRTREMVVFVEGYNIISGLLG